MSDEVESIGGLSTGSSVLIYILIASVGYWIIVAIYYGYKSNKRKNSQASAVSSPFKTL